MKMQAALWYGPEDLRLEERPVPAPGAGEVLLKVSEALTCGTDFKFFRRGHAILAKTVPSFFGHEVSGIVAAVGPGVTQVKEGDAIVTSNSAPCGQCFYCAKKQENLCEDLLLLNGAFAEYLLIPARIVSRNIYRVPQQLSLRDAACTEPLASVVRTAHLLKISPEDTVMIIGSGPTGLLWVQVARSLGAQVISVARSDAKLETAKSLGAFRTQAIGKLEDPSAVLKGLANQGRGPDVVVDAAGQPSTWELAFQVVRPGGRVGFYGGCAHGTKITLDTHKLHYQEINLLGTFHHTPDDFQRSLSLLASGSIQVAPLIAGEVALSNIGDVFQKGVPETPLKYVIKP